MKCYSTPRFRSLIGPMIILYIQETVEQLLSALYYYTFIQREINKNND